ncbi:MAG: hypothetical protein K8R87_09370 [Verrucomicrobia bacterium]|nr:hypothetical protein [Verrucomicrobiota bacterium]
MIAKEKVLRAFRQFMSRDHYLLSVQANERSLTHRLAIYIEQEFPDFNVDCEFQKYGRESKILQRFKKSDAPNSGLAYPDVIVHHRGTDDNFIVLEAKNSITDTAEVCKKSSACDCDRCKLWAYRKELGYRHAFYIVFPFNQELESFSFAQIEKYLTEIVEDPANPVAVRV